MSSQLPVLLAWAFFGSFLMGLLYTSRWKAVLLSVIAVWCANIEQSDIERVTAGTIEGYALFAFLSAAVWLPTIAVSLIGSDFGARVRDLLTPAAEDTDGDAASEETAQ